MIKESVTDDAIIDLMNVHKIELWSTGGNQAEKEYVCAECRKLGISDGEMNWSE